MNNFFAIGRLVKDIEVRHTRNNKAVGDFSIAITRNYKNQDGEYEVDFINCELWGKLVETMQVYTHKGDMISVAGSIRTDKYEDGKGGTKTRTYILVSEVHFLTYGKKKEIDNDLPEDNLEMPF